MARPRRKFAGPLVITIAAAAPACGGATESDDFTTNPPHPQEIATNPPSVEILPDGPELLPACDASNLAWGECSAGESCLLKTECTGGEPREFEFECIQDGETGRWQSSPGACERKSEQCLPVETSHVRFSCHAETWSVLLDGGGENPPAPCPTVRPRKGEACSAGYGFGADPDSCGYPCDDGSWTVMGCFVGDDTVFAPQPSAWEGDSACGVGGAAGGSAIE